MSKIGSYLLANSLRANLAALFFMLLPLPIFGAAIAAIIVALVTLRRGALLGLAVLAWTALPAVAASLKLPLLAAHYDWSFFACALTWFAAVVLRRQFSWSRTVEVLTFLGLVYVSSLFLLPDNALTYLTTPLEQATLYALKQVASLDFAVVKGVIHDKITFLLGIIYFVLCFVTLIYLMLARAWQLSIDCAGKKWHEFYNIRVNRWLSLLAVLLVSAAVFWDNNWLQAAAFVVSLPFLLSGFSMLIYLCCAHDSDKKLVHIALLMLVIAMSLLVPVIAFVSLALLGFADAWINFRQLTWLRCCHRSEIKPKRTNL